MTTNTPAKPSTLEIAARQLIKSIPSPSVAQVYRETAQQLGIPLWMLIVGLLQRVYDNGEHTAPVLDPAWTFGNPLERPALPESVCKQCDRTFSPRWIGQEYCDVKCGSAAAKLAADRARVDSPLVRHQVGSEPPTVAKSTISEFEAHGLGNPGPQFIEMGNETEELGGKPGRAELDDPVKAIEAEIRSANGESSQVTI